MDRLPRIIAAYGYRLTDRLIGSLGIFLPRSQEASPRVWPKHWAGPLQQTETAISVEEARQSHARGPEMIYFVRARLEIAKRVHQLKTA